MRPDSRERLPQSRQRAGRQWRAVDKTLVLLKMRLSPCPGQHCVHAGCVPCEPVARLDERARDGWLDEEAERTSSVHRLGIDLARRDRSLDQRAGGLVRMANIT